MTENSRITDSEKQLLHTIVNHPEASMKELLPYTEYKWERTVKRKIKQLKERRFLWGPVYDINYTKLCKNPLHKLLCIIESSQSLDTVISYLKMIEPLLWIFPVMSSHKRVLNAGFFSTNNAKTANILQLLKDSNIITDFIIRVFRSKRMIENPNLFGEFNPPFNTLLEPCDIPDMSLEKHDTDLNECDLRILPYIERGMRLIDILRKGHFQGVLTYEQIKYSREKMRKCKLIEKKYSIIPFTHSQCVEFQLFMKIEDKNLIPRIIYNFARGERVFKQYAVFEEWKSKTLLGSVSCLCHPLFFRDVMEKLDQIDEISEKEIYMRRSFSREDYVFCPSQFKHFDTETQTLQYPYHVYEEKIKEKIEEDHVIVPV